MTRINCVPVTELSVKHLVAEYRELPRVYALAVAAYARGESPEQHGRAYTLGRGHVRFFYSRLGYIAARHRQLIAEMKRRKFHPSYDIVLLPDLPQAWCRNWRPTVEAQRINRERIKERTK
jgi:hypothetical protein